MYSLKMSVSRGPWMACDEKMCAPDIFSPANAFPCFLQWFWSRPHPRPHIRSSQPCDQDQDEREWSPCKVGRPWLVHTAEGSHHTGPGSIFIININVLAIIELPTASSFWKGASTSASTSLWRRGRRRSNLSLNPPTWSENDTLNFVWIDEKNGDIQLEGSVRPHSSPLAPYLPHCAQKPVLYYDFLNMIMSTYDSPHFRISTKRL